MSAKPVEIYSLFGPVRAAAVLPYRGLEISLSTIPNVPEMRLFDGREDVTRVITGRSSLTPTAPDVVAAVRWIDEFLDGGGLQARKGGRPKAGRAKP